MFGKVICTIYIPELDKDEEELAGAKKAIRTVGGKTSRIEGIGSADTEFNHNIIFIEKIKNTPAQYPRKAGTPSKSPIK